MSLDATRWAWMQPVGRSSAKLVLLSLADRADEHHEAYPSIVRLCRDTELDRKTVLVNIAYLVEIGVIMARKTPGCVTHYRLIGVDDRHSSPSKPVPFSVPVPKTVPVPKKGLDQYQKRDGTSPKIGTRTYQEPIKNQEERQNTENVVAKTARGARLSLVALPNEWRDWTREHHPLINPEHTWEIFRDYWIAESGTKAAKHDWLATWRNWVRREQKSLGAARGQHHRTDQLADINAEWRRRGQQAFDEVVGGLAG